MSVTAPPRPSHSSDDRDGPIDREELEALVEALIEEARQRARRRRRKYGAFALLAALAVAAAFVVLGRTAAGSQPSSPSNPLSAPPTRSSLAAHGGFVSAFAFDPRAADTVYAATSGYGLDHGGRVYKTTDAGLHWRSTTDSDWTRIDVLAADPRHPETLYAGTGTAVFKTVNGGRSWRAASRGLFSGPPHIGPAPAFRRRWGWVTSLAVDPTDSDIVYAGTPTGVRRSTDAGRSWRTVLRQGKYMQGAALELTSTRPQVVYAATVISGPAHCGVHDPPPHDQTHCGLSKWLSTSTDGGATWRSTRLPLTTTSSSIMLAIDPRRPTTLYLASGTAVLKSTDAGASWRSIVDGLAKHQVSSLAIDPRRSGTVYLTMGLYGGMFKTTNGGRTWRRFSLGFGVLTFAVNPARPATIYAAVDKDHRNRILRSNNGGRTWATAG